MNKILLTITTALLMVVMPAKATDYREIRDYALFLTDKMAYELNLSEEQYEAAYEINFDYLCDVLSYNEYDDLYGRAWSLRNRDLRYILLEAQYNMFARLNYFYRPCYFSHGVINIRIYNYYPRRDYLYFGCPNFVVTYRGGHGWRHHRHRSYYAGRAWHRSDCYGMRDGYRDGRRYYHRATNNHGWRIDRNDNGHHNIHRGHGWRTDNDRNTVNGFRGNRGHVSSTRTTVNNNNNGNRGFGGGRSNGSLSSDRRLPDNRFSPRKANDVNRGGSVSIDRGNRSNVSRSNNSSINRPSRSNVSRSNRSTLRSESRSNVSRSNRSKSNNESRNNSRNSGFGGGR